MDQIQVCDPLALFDRGDEMRAAIELIDDLEDDLVVSIRADEQQVL